MKLMRWLLCSLLIGGLMTAAWSSAFADTLLAYPLKGQSAQQQQLDRMECHQWAVAQSGFDPNSVASDPSARSGAMKGLFVGLVAGGIVAATGGAAAAIAIGAGGGGLIGGILGGDKKKKLMAANAAYLAAAQTCMAAKGYQVSS
jgi:hypothetical protein